MKNYSKTKIFLLTSLLASMASAHGQSAVGTWLDAGTVKSVLTNGWQVGLNTDKDPANNNQWNTNDGGNGFGVGGLLGGLQETRIETRFGAPIPYPVHFVIKRQVTVPNGTDGTITYAANLEFTDSASVSDSSSLSNSVKTGAEISFKVSASAFGMGAEAGGKVSEDFTRTSATANTTTTTRQEKFSSNLSVVVPARSTYLVTLICQEEKVDLPYQSDIRITGTSHTWFPDRVNGHYNWNQNVGGVLAHANNLPRGWNLPGDGSVVIEGAHGKLTAQQSTNCSAATQNITNLPAASVPSLPRVRGNSIASLVQPGATLVGVTPIRR